MANNLCGSCSSGIWCGTWGQWKCSMKKRRIYETLTKCDSFAKKPKNWKEMRCQCKDCLRNESLAEELEEESEV